MEYKNETSPNDYKLALDYPYGLEITDNWITSHLVVKGKDVATYIPIDSLEALYMLEDIFKSIISFSNVEVDTNLSKYFKLIEKDLEENNDKKTSSQSTTEEKNDKDIL